MSLTSSGVKSPDPPVDLATLLQRLTAKLNTYNGVTATVEPLEIPVKPEDAERVNDALYHGNAVTFTAPKSRSNGNTRRRNATRQRSRERRPGASRRASSSSRSSSADPGDSDSGDEPEPPASGRRCAAPWCEHVCYGPPKQRYCGTEHCDRARAAERQRKRRHGDLSALERERLENARRAGMIGEEAFAGPEKHSLSFLWKFALVDGFDPGEYEALLNRPACRCNGHHIDDGDGGCFKCGLARSEVVACC